RPPHRGQVPRRAQHPLVDRQKADLLMKTEILGRNTPVDDKLRKRVEAKLGKLEKFLEEPLEARVTLIAEKHSFLAELHVTHRDGVLQGNEQTDGSFQEAV